MQALAERIEEWLLGATFAGYVPLGFSGRRPRRPHPTSWSGARSRAWAGGRSTCCSSSTGARAPHRVPPVAGRSLSTSSSRPRRPSPRVPWCAGASPTPTPPTRRPCCCASGARSARRAGGCSGPATRARSRARPRGDERRVRRVAAHRHRRAARAHHPARPAHGCGRRPGLRRRRAARGAALALRVAQVVGARRTRAPPRRDRRRARRRPRTRAHVYGRALGQQARRALHGARQGRPPAARCAATT